ncbi:hypothetical protein ACFP1Z_16600 [Streptomyces gamaensis]|uniref:Uncharacterized protein n=1 Tax=Streptomyces gamaensis TaxID=1763542 RepID=A0ABW0Z223_9ACTN
MTTDPTRSADPADPAKHPLYPLKRLLEIIAFILIVGGATGLLREWIGWKWLHLFGFFHYVIPTGYEVYGYIVLVVLGLAVGGASETLTRTDKVHR